MKISKHVEKLLREGRNPKEFVELGFPKSVVTRVRRQLKAEKPPKGLKVTEDRTQAKSYSQASAASPANVALAEERLASMEGEIQALQDQVEVLSMSVDEIESRLDGTPALGLKHRFTCSCGASGFVALHIQCTKCQRETWWGWFPKQ
jgi:hypothetical protein